jgi:DNA-directed RNA polymerase subunit N (RpoN/RPB10)
MNYYVMSRKQLEKEVKQVMADSGYDRYCFIPDRVASMTHIELIEYLEA